MSSEPNRKNLANRKNLPTGLDESDSFDEKFSDQSNGPNGPNGEDNGNGSNGQNNGKRNHKSKSTVTKAHPKSPSLRTTIPRQIIEILEWDSGDVLSWEIEKRGDKYYVIIRRLE